MKYYKISIFILLFINIFVIWQLHDNYYQEKAIKIPIITFHRLVLDNIKKEKYPNNQWVGSIDVFEEMMNYLYENQYNTISTEEFLEWYKGNINLPKKSILITFDDGFYEDYYLAYPILKKYNIKATSFIVGSRINDVTAEFDKSGTKIAYIGKDIITKIKKEYPNWEFQSHSYDLHKYDKNTLHHVKNASKEELINDIKVMKDMGFNLIAYPFGDFTNDLIDALEINNIPIAFGFKVKTYATKNDKWYNIHRIKINGNATLSYLKKWLKYL